MKNKLRSALYYNLIRKGIALNKLLWVEEFIKDNTKYLEEKDKENLYNYAKALLEFAKENYEESFELWFKIINKNSLL